jgi:hypothetical protein
MKVAQALSAVSTVFLDTALARVSEIQVLLVDDLEV